MDISFAMKAKNAATKRRTGRGIWPDADNIEFFRSVTLSQRISVERVYTETENMLNNFPNQAMGIFLVDKKNE